MSALPIIANLRKAARDRSLTTIGGGVFAPAEVEQAARLLEAVPELVAALESCAAALHTRAGYLKTDKAAQAVAAAGVALASIEGVL